MKKLLLLLLMLATAAVGQPPPSPQPLQLLTTPTRGEVKVGEEYTSPGLKAEAADNPAYFSYMIRATNSEPWRVPGSERLVWRDVRVLLAVNLTLVLALFLRRRFR